MQGLQPLICSGETHKLGEIRQVFLKTGQGMVPAFQQRDLRVAVAGMHFTPVQYLIPFGQEGAVALWVLEFADLQGAQFVYIFGQKKKLSSGACHWRFSPMYLPNPVQGPG